MGHHTHTNPLTKRSSQCKVCKSDLCREIEEAIIKKMPRSDIIAFAEKAQPGINLTKSNLVNHKKKHMLTTETSLKIIDIKKGAKENQDSDKGEESGLSDEQLLSLSTFLDLVIEKVNNRVKNGSLKPTVAEAVKAAEIKAKIKEASKFEKEMVKFFTEVSLKHGYSN